MKGLGTLQQTNFSPNITNLLGTSQLPTHSRVFENQCAATHTAFLCAVAQPDLLGLAALEKRMPKQITVPLGVLSALVRGINRAAS
jgi:hypothetical protein